MRKYPNIVSVDQVIKSSKENAVLINGKFVPARSVGFMSIWQRFKAAYLVFTGKADALTWEGQ